MTASTHFIFSAFIISIFTKNVNVILISSCFSLLPDIDHPLSLIGRLLFFISEPINKRFGHRTITHSFFAIVAFSVLLFPLFFFDHLLYAMSILAFASHPIADTFNLTGVRFFYPLSDKEFVAYRTEKMRIPVKSWKEFLISIVLVFFLASMFHHSFSLNAAIRKISSGIYKSYDIAYTDFKESAENICLAEIEYYDLVTRRTLEHKLMVLNMDPTAVILYTPEKLRLIISKQDVKNIKIITTKHKFQTQYIESDKLENLKQTAAEKFITGNMTLYNYGLQLIPSKSMFYDKSLNDSFVTLNFARIADINDLIKVLEGVPSELESLKLKLSENKLSLLQEKEKNLNNQIKNLKRNFYKNYTTIKTISAQLMQIQNKIIQIQSGVVLIDENKLQEDIRKLESFRLHYKLYTYSLPDVETLNLTSLSTQ
jgi:membrane-bound metal-dependent hydrolase YbcI (DUF457 family)